MKPICTLKNITKRFPGVVALDNVDLDLYEGEVHALLGENGAGKSTLMKILSGVHPKDSGTISIDGKVASYNSVEGALKSGISMVYQELNTLPEMTVAENIFLGHEPKNSITKTVSAKKMIQQTDELFKKLKIEWIDPQSYMKSLSVAEAQLVEIAKVVMHDSRFIIMDEPTSAITDREAERLFEIIADLKSKGVSIIYISHRLEEIFRIADRVTIMRDGKVVTSDTIEKFTVSSVIGLMVGRDLADVYPAKRTQVGEVALEVRGLSYGNKFSNINFCANASEILGIAGLMGAGRTEIAETIFGLRKKSAGQIFIRGKEVQIKKPAQAIKNGIALITEDRKGNGLVLTSSILDNIILVAIKRVAKLGWIRKKKALRLVDEQIGQLKIKTPSRDQLVKNLSGGNQQKVVLGKWLLSNVDIIIFDEPTRGIDVGAKAEIYKLMSSLAESGKAIIMISSEMPEILGMSDRIIALHEGKVTGVFTKENMNEYNLMQSLVGYDVNAEKMTN